MPSSTHCIVFHPLLAAPEFPRRSCERDLESVPLLAERPGKKGRGQLPALAKEVSGVGGVPEAVGSRRPDRLHSRVVFYTLDIVRRAFAGHIGDLELAAFSIVNSHQRPQLRLPGMCTYGVAWVPVQLCIPSDQTVLLCYAKCALNRLILEKFYITFYW